MVFFDENLHSLWYIYYSTNIHSSFEIVQSVFAYVIAQRESLKLSYTGFNSSLITRIVNRAS